MIKALFLDLDDTLLGNNTHTFMEHYFALLSDYARPYFDKTTFLTSLLQSTRNVIENTDPGLTNADVFWSSFQAMIGGHRDELEPFFQQFYETEFPRLQSTTVFRPEAPELVKAAFKSGLAVVIATNPLFPRTAIEQRLEWAGVPVTDYPYALVTTYENMHAAKPQPAYYQEILTVVGCSAGEAIMAGDDWKNDILPAAALGMTVYWVSDKTNEVPDKTFVKGVGSLSDLKSALLSGDLIPADNTSPA